MAFEINIIGEVIPFDTYGMDGYVNLTEVENQLKNAGGEDIKVNINSWGGDVEEGFLIYTALRKYAQENNAKVTTYAKGRCYSIATVIFLSGDERVLNKYIAPFVHNAWNYAMGDANELRRVAVDLENVNKKIGQFYAEHTNLTYEEARELMQNETSIEPEEALNIRFGTSIEEVLRPVALNKIFNKKNNSEMTTIKDEKGLMAAIKNFFKADGPKNLELFTSASETLLFPDLEEGQAPKVGDKATIDGKAAEGEITLQDGTVYVFVAGVLEEIKKADGDDDNDADRIAELEAENSKLKEQLDAQNSKMSTLESKVSEMESNWKNFKNLVSNHVVDDPQNGKKTTTKDEGGEKKGGLASAAKNLGKDK